MEMTVRNHIITARSHFDSFCLTNLNPEQKQKRIVSTITTGGKKKVKKKQLKKLINEFQRRIETVRIRIKSTRRSNTKIETDENRNGRVRTYRKRRERNGRHERMEKEQSRLFGS